MQTNIALLVDRVRPQAGIPLIVCDCPSPAPQDGTAELWVFRQRAPNRLQQRFAGVLSRPEIDEFKSRLREQTSVWPGGIDSLHAPPSRRFRLVWTLPPAPCRIYSRRGWGVEVESALVTRHSFWRREEFAVHSPSGVEGWIAGDWRYSGISVKAHGSGEREVVRLENAGLITQFLLMYDGIDLLVDTGWLDRVVPRVAEVFGVGWKIVDYTVTPPKIVRHSGPTT